MEKDILVTQEGQNVVVQIKSEKARKAFYNKEKNTTPKAKLKVLSESIANIIAWAIINDLTVESKLKIVLKAK